MNCVRERICQDVVPVCDRNLQMAFEKAGFISGEFYSSFDENRALSVLRARQAEQNVLRAQSVNTGQELETQKKMLNSFVLFRG